MKRIFLSSLLICAALALGVDAAAAAKKEKEAAPKPEKIGTYGDWSVFHSGAGKAKLCYVLAEPKTRDPADEKAEKAYAFISERPAEKVRNEVSFVMGFEIATAATHDSKDKPKDKDAKKPKKPKKDDEDEAATPARPIAAIGEEEFDLIPRGNDLWVKNPAEEGKVIEEMRKGVALVIKAGAKHGKPTTDTYSLSGFSQAVDKALKDCPSL
jgi:invasion protein IalB